MIIITLNINMMGNDGMMGMLKWFQNDFKMTLDINISMM